MKLHVWAAIPLILLSTAVFAAEGESSTGITLPSINLEKKPEPQVEVPQPLPFPTVELPGSDKSIAPVMDVPPKLPDITQDNPIELPKNPPAKADSQAVEKPQLPTLGGDIALPAMPGVPQDEKFPVQPDLQPQALKMVDSLFGKKEEGDVKTVTQIEPDKKADEAADLSTREDTAKEEDRNAGNKEITGSEDSQEKLKKKRKSRKVASYQGKGFAYRTQMLPDTIYMREYPRGNRSLPKAQYEQEWDRLMFVTASANNLNGLRALLNTGRTPDMRDNLGQTPLIVAIRYGARNTARLLLARGANPNAMDNAGNSAMHYAVSNNNYPMVRALIEMGARYDLADSRGVTPVMIAEQGRNPLIMAAMGM